MNKITALDNRIRGITKKDYTGKVTALPLEEFHFDCYAKGKFHNGIADAGFSFNGQPVFLVRELCDCGELNCWFGIEE